MLVVLLLKSCGSDTLSAQDLRTQASEICIRVNATTDRIAVPNAPAGGERFLSEGLVLMRPALARLQRLKPPHELSDDYALAVSANARQLQLVGQTIDGDQRRRRPDRRLPGAAEKTRSSRRRERTKRGTG